MKKVISCNPTHINRPGVPEISPQFLIFTLHSSLSEDVFNWSVTLSLIIIPT
jgi:hypothetical protein